MEYECFRVECDPDGVATVTFDRPPVNAQNRRSREEVTAIFDELSDTDEVRAVILTGAGHVFSAGADIKERRGIQAERGDYLRHNRLTREAFFAISACAKPVIAAINGPAIGAGFAFAACSDILICADDAYIQMPELDRGLAGGIKFLEEHFPRTFVRYLFLTGEKIHAPELLRLGVVCDVTPRGELLDRAREIARMIAAKSPVAVAKAKAAFGAVKDMSLVDGYRYEQGITIELSRTADAREAQSAFVEGRSAAFGE